MNEKPQPDLIELDGAVVGFCTIRCVHLVHYDNRTYDCLLRDERTCTGTPCLPWVLEQLKK